MFSLEMKYVWEVFYVYASDIYMHAATEREDDAYAWILTREGR